MNPYKLPKEIIQYRSMYPYSTNIDSIRTKLVDCIKYIDSLQYHDFTYVADILMNLEIDDYSQLSVIKFRVKNNNKKHELILSKYLNKFIKSDIIYFGTYNVYTFLYNEYIYADTIERLYYLNNWSGFVLSLFSGHRNTPTKVLSDIAKNCDDSHVAYVLAGNENILVDDLEHIREKFKFYGGVVTEAERTLKNKLINGEI